MAKIRLYRGWTFEAHICQTGIYRPSFHTWHFRTIPCMRDSQILKSWCGNSESFGLLSAAEGEVGRGRGVTEEGVEGGPYTGSCMSTCQGKWLWLYMSVGMVLCVCVCVCVCGCGRMGGVITVFSVEDCLCLCETRTVSEHFLCLQARVVCHSQTTNTECI